MHRDEFFKRAVARRLLGVTILAAVCTTAVSTLAAVDRNETPSEERFTVTILAVATFDSGTVLVMEKESSLSWQFHASSHGSEGQAGASLEPLIVDVEHHRSVFVPGWDKDGPVTVLFFDSLQWHALQEQHLLPSGVFDALAPSATSVMPSRTYLVRDIAQNADVLSRLLSLPREGAPQPIGGVVEPVEHCEMVQSFNPNGTITAKCEGGCDEGQACNMVVEVVETGRGPAVARMRCKCT